MAPRTQYDLGLFRTLVKTGRTKNEIVEEMGIKNSATFNNILLRLMETDKKYYAIKISNKKLAKKVHKTTIGKNFTLTLSAKMLEDTGFIEGDAFNIKVAKDKIILTLIED